MTGYQKVGDWLVAKGILTPEQRDEALKTQLAGNRRFGEVIVSLGFATERQVTECLSEQYEMPFLELSFVKPSADALKILSPTFALSRLILPYEVTETEIKCVISDPLDLDLTDELSQTTGKRLSLSLAGPIELFEAITYHYELARYPDRGTFTVGGETPDIRVTKKESKPRKVKVDEQADRKELLGSLGSSGPNPLWDWYEVD